MMDNRELKGKIINVLEHIPGIVSFSTPGDISVEQISSDDRKIEAIKIENSGREILLRIYIFIWRGVRARNITSEITKILSVKLREEKIRNFRINIYINGVM